MKSDIMRKSVFYQNCIRYFYPVTQNTDDTNFWKEFSWIELEVVSG